MLSMFATFFAWFSEILQVKILQRNANLDGSSVTVGPPPEQDALAVNALKRLQDIPLDVPKKTKLWAPRDVHALQNEHLNAHVLF